MQYKGYIRKPFTLSAGDTYELTLCELWKKSAPRFTFICCLRVPCRLDLFGHLWDYNPFFISDFCVFIVPPVASDLISDVRHRTKYHSDLFFTFIMCLWTEKIVSDICLPLKSMAKNDPAPRISQTAIMMFKGNQNNSVAVWRSHVRFESTWYSRSVRPLTRVSMIEAKTDEEQTMIHAQGNRN